MRPDHPLISQMCAGPVGCAFLQIVEDNELPSNVTVTPEVAFTIAALAVEAVSPHSGDHAERVISALAQGSRLASLARSLLTEPGADWWFGPIDRDTQLWVGRERKPLDLGGLMPSVNEPTSWERYAQKAEDALYTSTIAGSLSSELIAIREGAGDYLPEPPYSRYRLRADPDARVFEITGPTAWQALCTMFSAIEPDGKLVPDWRAIAQRWDAVHLTLGGLLTAEQVRLESGEHWTQFGGWNAEQTLWLHDRFVQVERWPDLPDVPAGDIEIFGWSYWGPTWDDNSQPWRARLGRIPTSHEVDNGSL